jgi:hypothetical protein
MKRFHISSLAWSAVLSAVLAGTVLATPLINGATVEERTFNDCPISVLTTTNNYPASVEITDDMHPACVGFANLHSFTLSDDGGTTDAKFANNSSFRLGADFTISGAGEGEGGLRVAPWWSPFVDGRFMANATTGEIACFGGRLPFYSFTGAHGITYTKGTTVRLEVTYMANGLSAADPATIQYRVIQGGMTYSSPALPFDMGNPGEDPPYGLWGMLNEARVGGYFQPRANTGAALTANWSNVEYTILGTPSPDGAFIAERTFNDCPISTLTSNNNYPAQIDITDEMDPACVGFANLHSWSFSDDGGASAAVFNNTSSFRYGCDFSIAGAGEGEGGLRIAPWWSPFVDGRFMANATTGEIACFGGRLPFYSFTGDHGITYVKGTTIHMEATYVANSNSAADPGTIQYRVVQGGTTYDSPVLPFDMANPGEDPPYGLYGILNNARVGGYFQPRANTGAALTATWSNIAFTDCPVMMAFEFNPSSLNVNSMGNWVTGYLQPQDGYAASDIDIASILLNGSVPVAAGAPTALGDENDDSIPDLMVKFSRAAIGMLLPEGENVPVTVSGLVDGDCFEGTDFIRVKGVILPSPVAGSTVVIGGGVEVIWDPDPEIDTVDLIASFDHGATWSVEARGLADDGQYHWTVPNVSTDGARLAVVVVASENHGDIVTAAELGESETFSIGATTDAVGPHLTFAIRGVHPNPAVGNFRVWFSLPNEKPAKLVVYNVAGRKVSERDLTHLGRGLHTVTLERHGLAAGVYMLKLTQSGQSVTKRAVLVD